MGFPSLPGVDSAPRVWTLLPCNLASYISNGPVLSNSFIEHQNNNFCALQVSADVDRDMRSREVFVSAMGWKGSHGQSVLRLKRDHQRSRMQADLNNESVLTIGAAPGAMRSGSDTLGTDILISKEVVRT